MSAWIQTYTGVKFDLLHPTPEMVRIEDIAHALASIARFTGHTGEPYSVAQHSVWVSERVPKEYALEGLLHDAAEAYIGDIATPIKRLLGPHVVALENRVRVAICEKFNIHPEAGEHEIRFWDLTALATERRDLMGPSPEPWHASVESKTPVPGKIRPWHPGAAETVFLRAFRDLVTQRHTGASRG